MKLRRNPFVVFGFALILSAALSSQTFADCGDSTLDPGEDCDDGNLVAGDCCGSGCLIEVQGTVCRAAVDVCDSIEVCDGVDPTCPVDQVEADTDLDTFCDALDVCPSVSDPLQTDTDDDGMGDACDPCTNFTQAALAIPRLTISRVNFPGDTRLKFKGRVRLMAGIDPIANGVRLILTNALDGTVVDATIPPGEFDPGSQTGWKGSGSGSIFVFQQNTGTPPGGIFRLILRATSGTEQYKFLIRARGATYAIDEATLPLRASLILAPPLAMLGECGEASFAQPNGQCSLINGGSRLICRSK